MEKQAAEEKKKALDLQSLKRKRKRRFKKALRKGHLSYSGLNLCDDFLSSFDGWVANIPAKWLPPSSRPIQTLNLRHNAFHSLPPSTFSASALYASLTRLDLGHNQLLYFPEALLQLSNLRHLSLIHNQLTYVPSSLCQLSSLTFLALSHNRIDWFPLCLLFRLSVLLLNNNLLVSFPQNSSSCSSSSSSSSSSCSSSSRPSSIITEEDIAAAKQLCSASSPLSVLNLSDNFLQQISPLVFDGAHLPSLTRLDLSKNRLQYPSSSSASSSGLSSLATLSSLVRLDLSFNARLKRLPSSLSLERLSSLVRLDLRHCRSLVELPSHFGFPPPFHSSSSSSLTRLDLSYNALLTQLPPAIGRLSSLRRLNLKSTASLRCLPGDRCSSFCVSAEQEEVEAEESDKMTELEARLMKAAVINPQRGRRGDVFGCCCSYKPTETNLNKKDEEVERRTAQQPPPVPTLLQFSLLVLLFSDNNKAEEEQKRESNEIDEEGGGMEKRWKKVPLEEIKWFWKGRERRCPRCCKFFFTLDENGPFYYYRRCTASASYFSSAPRYFLFQRYLCPFCCRDIEK